MLETFNVSFLFINFLLYIYNCSEHSCQAPQTTTHKKQQKLIKFLRLITRCCGFYSSDASGYICFQQLLIHIEHF